VTTGEPLEIRFSLRTKLRPPSEGVEQSSLRQIGRLPRITQALALAIHLEDMIRRGEAKDYADLARLSCLSRERISQIVRLNFLAPDIQVELLYLAPTNRSRFPISETALRKIANLFSWVHQRREWAALKERHHLSGVSK
jgi:hypothetical protein